MGLWDEGNPGILSGRKKVKSRGGVPALEFNPPDLRWTEEKQSDLKETIEIYENQCKSMKIYGNSWKSEKIFDKSWKSMKINEIDEHVWDIPVLKKNMVIFYILNI